MNEQAEKALQHRHYGAAQAFIDQCLAAGRVSFPLAELTTKTGLSAIAAKRQLSRLDNKVTRVSPRQPFYLIVSPEFRELGAPPATWWLHEYFQWCGQPYYLALQSAASLYGSNPQALQVTQVMTDRPLRSIAVGRSKIRFFVKRGISSTATQQPAGLAAPLLVSTPEATVYDLVRYADRIGGLERAAETISPLLKRVRVPALKEAVKAGGETSCKMRLGSILQSLGSHQLAGAVHDCLGRRRVAQTATYEGGTKGIRS